MGVRLILEALGVCGGVPVLVRKEKSRERQMMEFILLVSELSRTVSNACFLFML